MPNLRHDAVRDPALETTLTRAIGWGLSRPALAGALGGSHRAPPSLGSVPRSSSLRSDTVAARNAERPARRRPCHPPTHHAASALPPATTAVAPAPVYAFQRVGSTMDVAHALAAQGASEGTLVFAARQEQGRGRLGRSWVSPDGGAYCSVILRPNRPPAEIPQLSLVAGLATAEAIRELAGLSPAIRWPNDVLLDGLKVAGILVEARSGAAVVGIGVNVTTDPTDLPPNSTSLKKCQTLPKAGKVSDTSVVAVTGALYRRFLAWYDLWHRSGFIPIREALRPLMGFFGEPVQLSTASEQLRGVASDLDESGRLLVRLDSGLSRVFDVGEVTLLRAHA